MNRIISTILPVLLSVTVVSALVAAPVFKLPPPPSLTTAVTVSGCYDSNGAAAGGTSQVTVQVAVDWDSPLAGEVIIVSVPGAATQTINPATASRHTVLYFTLPTSSAISGDVTANFDVTTSVVALPVPISIAVSNCLQTPCQSGNTGGMVFKDFNANGLKDASETVGIASIIVKAYWDNAGTVGVATTTTGANGDYEFATGSGANEIPNGAKARIEFSGLPQGVYGSSAGTNNGTNIQFVTVPTCAVDFGANFPSDYCQADPLVTVTRFTNGEASSGGGQPALYAFNFSSGGTHSTDFGINIPSVYANTQNIGSVWGGAYDRNRQVLYSAAFLKRHVGLLDKNGDGKGDLGMIYKIPKAGGYANDTNLGWLDVTTLGINVGMALMPTDAVRNLGWYQSPNRDAAVFDLVGKIGLGDIDISEDGQTLYFVNLYDQKLYALDISTNTPSIVSGYPVAIPDPCVGGSGSSRPFALAVKGLDVFVGTICDASASRSIDDLNAQVYKYSGGTWSPVISQPIALNYVKGCTFQTAPNCTDNWNVWENGYYAMDFNAPNLAHPEIGYWNLHQPFMTDIEFDDKGDIVLGFSDRTSLQMFGGNEAPNGSTENSNSSGELLHLSRQANGIYFVENNGSAGITVTGGANNNQGIGGGEYYYQENLPLFQNWDNFFNHNQVTMAHQETAQGALVIMPGTNRMIATTMDPVGVNEGGVSWFINSGTNAGKVDRFKQIFTSDYDPNVSVATNGTTGKGVGLGDLEIMCDAAPIEIGNLVWLDANANGIQDPAEIGIPNTKVQLFSRTGALVGVTATNAKGEYYFNTSNVDTIGVSADGLTPNFTWSGLSYKTPYYIVFGNGGANTFVNGKLSVAGINYQLTTPNTGQGTNSDMNDSDAQIAAAVHPDFNGFPYIPIIAGKAGQSNHTYEIGFKPPSGSVGNYVWNDTNADGQQNDGAGSGINGITVELWNNDTNTSAGTTQTANDGSGNAGYYNFVVTTSGNYYVKFPLTNATGQPLITPNTTAATDNNSDAAISTGFSPTFYIDINGTGADKDNTTIDAGYGCPISSCIPITRVKTK
jgi:SdrD B-like domain